MQSFKVRARSDPHRTSQGRMLSMIVSGPGVGYGLWDQFPRCSPPLIRILGGIEPVPKCTAACPPFPEPIFVLENLYPGEFEALTTMPY